MSGRELLRPVVLVGPPGAGKSTLGARAARSLRVPFVDLDEAIERAAGRSVSALFAAEGELGFRVAELVALERALLDGCPKVIAAGGGATMTAAARERLSRHARVVLVDVRADVAHVRLAGSAPRPLLGEEPGRWPATFEALEAPRRAARAALAEARLDTSDFDLEGAAKALAAVLADDAPSLSPDEGARARAGVQLIDSADLLRALQVAVGQRRPYVLVDAGAPRALASAEAAFGRERLLVVEGGEGLKSPARLLELCEQALADGVTRETPVVALGGGALLDVAGLLAATLHRGVPWVAVPTTLLAMVDASLGGKTAVNLSVGKNLFGAFHAPQSVLIEPTLLETLPLRAFAAGAAELLKHAFLCGDAPTDGSAHPVDAPISALARGELAAPGRAAIARSLALKARVVEADPREGGLRRILNLGHTFGHAIERASLEGPAPLLHGEAIRHGLALAVALSVERAGLDAKVAERLLARVDALPAPAAPPLDAAGFRAAFAVDKKRGAGGVVTVLLAAPGRPVVVRLPPDELARFAAEHGPYA